MADHNKIYKDQADYFRRADRNTLRFDGPSAIAVCNDAANHDMYIARVEGGRWLDPGFEARLDSIWTITRLKLSKNEANHNNCEAAKFIYKQMTANMQDSLPPPNAFILTSRPVSKEEAPRAMKERSIDRP